MEWKIDLHLHTYYSDGTLSPTEMVKWAKKQNLDQIAITDHDGILGVREAMIASEALELSCLPGVELSARLGDSISFHLLGYRIDIENQELLEVLSRLQDGRKRRNQLLLEALNSLGYPLDPSDFQKKGNKDYLGKPDFARALLKKGYISRFEEAFEEGMFLNAKEIGSIRKEKLEAKEAIELISKAGGTPVLAHPMKVKGILGDYFTALNDLVGELKRYGLKGIECYYPEHSEEETMKLLQLAEKYKLHVTKGTDYHGPK